MNATPRIAYRPSPDLLPREPLPAADLLPQVVTDELHRLRAKIGYLDQIREDPVSVELEQRNQVQEDHEVVQERELVEGRRERPVRERPGERRRGAGDDELRVRPSERLHDPLAAVHHQAVGGVDEERGRSEVDHEPGALDASPVVHQDDRVTQLVHEREEVAHRPAGRAIRRPATRWRGRTCRPGTRTRTRGSRRPPPGARAAPTHGMNTHRSR